MHSKPSKKRDEPDIAQNAFRVMQESTGQIPKSEPPDAPSPDMISAVMRELGRRGGLKGGKARADGMSKKQRSEIAKKAAKARWGKKA